MRPPCRETLFSYSGSNVMREDGMENRFIPRAGIAIALALAFLGTSVRGDMAPRIFPEGNLDIHVMFENLGDYPEYDFYLKYGLGPGRPPALQYYLTPMVAATPIRLEGRGSSMTAVFLCAVPRGKRLPDPPDWRDTKTDWLRSPPEDGLQSEALPTGMENGMVSAHEDGHQIVYRISIEGKRLRTILVADTVPGRSAWLAGIGLSVTLAIPVIVWLRRSRKSPPDPAGTEQA